MLRHGEAVPAAVGAFGLGVMAGAMQLPHDGSNGEALWTIVGVALLVTGGLVGLLSGASPWKRGLRQLGIGFGAALATYADALPADSEPSSNAEVVKAIFNQTMEAQGLKPGQVLQALRVAVTGAGAGPDLFETLAILGTGEVAQRLRTAVERLG